MRVFVAGASGVIGQRLLPQLREAGHEATGMASSEAGAERVRSLGADAVVCDALDAGAVRDTVKASRPEVVISQLTRLPKEDYDFRTVEYGPTNRLRIEGGRNLMAAGRESGTRRYITQSVAFIYRPEGDWIKDETAPTMEGVPGRFGRGLEGTLQSEREALEAEGLEGIVLRYGWFCGPGTYYEADGSFGRQVSSRRLPVVGSGEGRTSFIHIDDAASATVAAAERGAPGIYNVVDDHPAPMREWIPFYSELLGAKRPFRVPKLVARMIAGRVVAENATSLRGASNEKAKRELGWTPRYPDWREGLRASLA